MSIIASEMVLYKSQVIAETTADGGRRSNTKVTSGVVNNLFPLVLPEERVSGARKVRKIFASVDNDADGVLFSAQVYLDAPTTGDDWVTMFAGTQRDTMADHSGSDNRYGVGYLATNIAAGGETLIVNVEDATVASMFRAGGTVCITDRTVPSSAASGNREFRTISAAAPTVSGTQVTMVLTEGVANPYTTTANTRVAAVLNCGDILCSVTNWSMSGSGTYDTATYPVLGDNLGTVEQTWTLTWSNATNFTCIGDTVGSVGSGVIGTNFSPVNPANGKPYFTLAAAGHGGVHGAGDTLTLQTHPAGYPIYLDWVIPAGASSIDVNRFNIIFLGYRA